MTDLLTNVELRSKKEIVIGYLDNDESEFKRVGAVLTRKGYAPDRIKFSTSKKEAEKWANENLVHILISDLKMEEISGDKFLEGIRNKHSNLPLLLFSGWFTEQYDLAPDLKTKSIETLNKLDINFLSIIIQEMVSAQYVDDSDFLEISNKIKPKESTSQIPEEKIRKASSKIIIEKFSELKKPVIEDFERIIKQGGENGKLTISKNINISIKDGIVEMENLTETGIEIIMFWINNNIFYEKKIKNN